MEMVQTVNQTNLAALRILDLLQIYESFRRLEVSSKDFAVVGDAMR